MLQAVEDADAITAVLSVIQSKQQLPAALKAYETSRKDRVLEMHAATLRVRQVYPKNGEAETARDENQKEPSEAKRTEAMLKAMQSTWIWDAAEAARTALSNLLKST